VVLTPAEAAAVVGGLPDCYGPTTAACDTPVKKCGEIECTIIKTEMTDAGPQHTYECPTTAEQQEQTQGAYNTVFQSAGGTKDGKKDEAKINCLKVALQRNWHLQRN